MIKKIKFLMLLFTSFLLSSCHQYHSQTYYERHPQDCVKRLEYCKKNYGNIMYENQDCANAYEAYLHLKQSDSNVK